jgi:hypothetical protein
MRVGRHAMDGRGAPFEQAALGSHAHMSVCIMLPCSKTLHRFWFENPAVARPVREDSGAGAASGDQRLFPRECREAVGGRCKHFPAGPAPSNKAVPALMSAMTN